MFMEKFYDTHLDTCHRIWQQDKTNCNVKIELCHWLLMCVHMSKTNYARSGLRPCDRNCSKFSPAPFWSHNQKGAQLSLLYLLPKANSKTLCSYEFQPIVALQVDSSRLTLSRQQAILDFRSSLTTQVVILHTCLIAYCLLQYQHKLMITKNYANNI